MLHDKIWRGIANEHETLCSDCFDNRLRDRKIDVTLADLRPCPFNLMNWPDSWFNVFLVQNNNGQIFVDAEWVPSMTADARRPSEFTV
jgi:hypothetical protein